jgi:hypothetical protein
VLLYSRAERRKTRALRKPFACRIMAFNQSTSIVTAYRN